jgi:ribosomal protein S18 acetylase RimI-like enzyme
LSSSARPTSNRVRLRPATAADRELLLAIFAATREQELAALGWGEEQRRAFVAQQFGFQDAHYRRAHPHASFDVVEVGGRPAGRQYVDRSRDEIRIVDVSLLPEFRGRGVGTQLLTALQDEAAATGRCVRLQVGSFNAGARRLYERLGFRVATAGDVYIAMEWTAQS